MAPLAQHAKQLYADLSGVESPKAPQQVVNAYNTLLGEAKKQHPEDAMLRTLEPIGAEISLFELRVLTGQIGVCLGLQPGD